MASGHVIGEMEVQISFDCEETALLEQGALGTFISKGILPLIDKVFSEESVPGVVYRIERLEVDLGRIAYDAFREQMAQRLEDKVREALRQKLLWSPSGATENPGQVGELGGTEEVAGAELVCDEDAELERLLFFLAHGHLPWLCNATAPLELEALLYRALRHPGGNLVRLLKRAPERFKMASRIARQFPEESLAMLAQLLIGDHQLSAPLLVQDLQSSLLSCRPSLQGSVKHLRSVIWEALLHLLLSEEPVSTLEVRLPGRVIPMLADREGITGSNVLLQTEGALAPGGRGASASDALVAAVAASGAATFSRGSSPAALPEWVAGALRSGSAQLLQPVWPELLQCRPMLGGVLRVQGREAEVRRNLARGLPDAMLLDLVALVEPSQAHFMKEVVTRPELFREAAELQQEDGSSVRQRLWEFTLAFLLVERTSEFNRKLYLGSILRQMAAHYNLHHRELLRSLRLVLNNSIQGALQEEMLELLVLLEVEGYGEESAAEGPAGAAGSSPPPSATAAQSSNPPLGMAARAAPLTSAPSPAGGRAFPVVTGESLRHAFSSGDLSPISAVWPALVTDMPHLVVQTLREPASPYLFARKMAQGFPQGVLRDVVTLLEPGESGFIVETVERPELFRKSVGAAQAEEDNLRRRLWEFTLLYLLAERGSQFNKKSYLGAVLRKLAIQYNLHYRQLLRSLQQIMGAVEVSSALRHEMVQLLAELAAEGVEPLPAESPAEALPPMPVQALWRDMTDAFYAGNAAVLHRWREFLSQPVSEVKALLAEASAQALLAPMLALLPEEALVATVASLAPREAGFIREVAGSATLMVQRDVATGAEEAETVRQHLWQFTLLFLSLDRGSAFNRKSYLDALLGEMASRQNMGARQLKVAFWRRIQNLTVGDPLKSMLSEFMREIFIPDEGEAPGDGAGSGEQQDHARVVSALRACLTSLDPGDTVTLATVVEYLARPDGGELRGLLLELQSGGVAADFLQRLSPRERELYLIAVSALAEERGGRALLQPQARNHELRPASAPPGGDGLPEAEMEDAAASEFRRLLTGTSRKQTSGISPQRLVETMLERWPGRLGELLERGLSEDAVAGMARLLPDQPLLRLLLLIGGMEARRLHEIVELVAATSSEGVAEGAAAESRILKWRFLFATIRSSAAHDASGAIEGYCDFLASHSGAAAEEVRVRLHEKVAKGGALKATEAEVALPGSPPGASAPAEPPVMSAGDVSPSGSLGQQAPFPGSEQPHPTPSRCEMKSVEGGRTQMEGRGNPGLSPSEGKGERGESSCTKVKGSAEGEDLFADAGAAALAADPQADVPDPSDAAINDVSGRVLAEAGPSTPGAGRPITDAGRLIPGAGLPTTQPGRLATQAGPSTTGATGPAGAAQTARYEAATGKAALSVGDAAVTPEEARAVTEATSLPGAAALLSGAAVVAGAARLCGEATGMAEGDRAAIHLSAPQEPQVPSGARAGQRGAAKSGNAAAELPEQAASAPSGSWKKEKPMELQREIYIRNAGLVLAAPYLPQLFRMLELVKERSFLDGAAAARGTHLLQFMVDGSSDSPEYLLVLNKILCGVNVDEPIAREAAIPDREKEVVEGLIQGMIRNWEAIGKTSVAGFRESFLQREGRLQLREDHWHLLVESRAYDLLLDRLPWSFSVTKFPWMPLPLHVDWREGL